VEIILGIRPALDVPVRRWHIKEEWALSQSVMEGGGLSSLRDVAAFCSRRR
jgi:hypothetical protein